MKYFIPIHRDNIDNVITAESLAPADYYSARAYGYRSFRVLKGFPSNTFICLFDNIVKIESEINAEKDLIVYIEVEGKYINTKKAYTFQGGLLVPGSIALYPWNCRFLFSNEESMRQATILCRSSLCNKMWNYYIFDLINAQPINLDKIDISVYNDECSNYIKEALNQDAAKNRQKGFLYTYILGRYVSLSQQLAFALQTERKMYDLATTIAGLRNYERGRFLGVLNDLEYVFERFDPNRTELQKRWQTMIESRFEGIANQKAFDDIILELECDSVMKAQFARKSGLNIRNKVDVVSSKSIDWNSYKKELDDYVQRQLSAFRNRKGDTNALDDFDINGLEICMKPRYSSFYGKLITKIIQGIDWLNPETIRLNKLDVASELTRMLRDIITESGQVWEGCSERTFMNDIRQHIASGGTYMISSAPDIVLKSLAVFILKGDDYEEMVRYMEYIAMADYRFVLGLWGACIGYTDIPKTSMQRMHLDSRSEAQIYMASHQLITEVPQGTHIEQHIYQFSKQKQELVVANNMLELIISNKGIGLTKTQVEIIVEILENNDGKLDEIFYEKVSKVKGVGKVKLKKIKEALNQQTIEKREPGLFDHQPNEGTKKFDLKAWQYIEPLLPNDPMVKAKVKDDLRWFVSYNKNNETIKRTLSEYKEHLKNKAYPTSPRYKWTAKYFGGLDIEKIIAKLEAVYL